MKRFFAFVVALLIGCATLYSATAMRSVPSLGDTCERGPADKHDLFELDLVLSACDHAVGRFRAQKWSKQSALNSILQLPAPELSLVRDRSANHRALMQLAQSPQVRAIVLQYKPPAAPAASGYTGPGDINGAAYAFWSTRCINTAYTGNVIDVFDGATGSTTRTLVTCSTGGVLNETVNALSVTCVVSCRVKTIYDQSGATNCTTACDLTQATNANRPILNTSLLGGKMGIVFNGTTNCLVGPATSSGQAQPYTATGVLNSAATGTPGDWLTDANNVEFYNHEGNNANRIDFFGGAAVVTFAATDSTTHAAQLFASGASSFYYVDGSAGSTANSGTTSFSGTPTMGAVAGATCTVHIFQGNIFEVGIWNGDKTANNSAMNSNQHSYWSF